MVKPFYKKKIHKQYTSMQCTGMHNFLYTMYNMCTGIHTTDRCGPKLKKSYKLLIRITIQVSLTHSKNGSNYAFTKIRETKPVNYQNYSAWDSLRVNIRMWFLRWKAYHDLWVCKWASSAGQYHQWKGYESALCLCEIKFFFLMPCMFLSLCY